MCLTCNSTANQYSLLPIAKNQKQRFYNHKIHHHLVPSFLARCGKEVVEGGSFRTLIHSKHVPLPFDYNTRYYIRRKRGGKINISRFMTA